MEKKQEKIIVKEPSIRMQELCNILGLTPTSIRNYEDNHAINTKRRDNGYRFYYFNDVLQGLNLKSFINLDLSLKEAKELSIHASLKDNQLKLEELSDNLDKKIAFLQHQKDRLEKIKYFYQLLIELQDQYVEKEMEGFYWLECQNQLDIINDEKKEIIAKWNNQSPFFFAACRNKYKTLSETQLADIGLLIYEQDKSLFEQEDLKYCTYTAPFPCVMTITKSNYKLTDYYSVIQKPLDYLKDNHYELVNDVISILIASDLMIDGSDDYYDYYLTIFPIKH